MNAPFFVPTSTRTLLMRNSLAGKISGIDFIRFHEPKD